ncbi:ABC transporter permease [Candidatus Saccharibacteria bacterium]|nr:ABC transporter permease [Candidatus Saccharibacteria bacterium]
MPNIFYRKNRILLKELVRTDFKLRYQGSTLGYLWAVLKPMMMFAVLYVVFVNFLRIGGDIPHFAVYLLAGIVFWNFFVESTSQGMQAIVIRGDLLRKVNFPKYILVVSSTVSALINFAINLGVVIIFALLNGVVPTWTWLLVPLLILEMYALSLGLAFLFGAINVKFRDISSIWDVLVQAMFYAVPIIYPITMVAEMSGTVAKILLLNPIAQIIQDVRYCLITHEAVTVWSFVGNSFVRLIPIILVVTILMLASMYFRKKSKYFAEEV